MLNYHVFFFLFILDTDLRRALDIALRDRPRVGCLALCWFAFQFVSMLRKGRDSACQQRFFSSLFLDIDIALMLTYNVFFSLFSRY